MSRSSLAALLLAALVSSSPVIANEGLSLSEAYSAYQADIEAGHDARQSAEQAYEIGQHVLDNNDKQLAFLAINYAMSLHGENTPRSRRDHKKAYRLYQTAQDIFGEHYDEMAVEHVDILHGIAHTAASRSNAVDAFEDAIEIAEHHQNSHLAADLRLAAVESLLNRFSGDAYYAARGFLREVEQHIEDDELQGTLLHVRSEFISALFDNGRGHLDRAAEKLENVVTLFDELDYDLPIELQAHAKLVELYETMDNSDEATEHCMAIGRMVPWQPDIEPEPLYRMPPKYPISKARRGIEGWVRLSFTVDEQGFVRDSKVIESKGGEAFEKVAIEALDQWRYAPRFKDGQPVAAKGFKVQLDFKLRS